MFQELAPQFKQKMVARTEKALAKARTKDSMAAFSKLTESVNGEVRIVDQSPLIVPIEQLAAGREREEMFERSTSCCAATVKRSSSTGACC